MAGPATASTVWAAHTRDKRQNPPIARGPELLPPGEVVRNPDNFPRLHAVQSFFHQAKLSVIQTVQPERDEFVVRELRLIFLSYPAHFGNRVELDPQTGDHLLPFLEEHLAIRLC